MQFVCIKTSFKIPYYSMKLKLVPIIIAFIIIGAGIFFLTKGANQSADIKSVANGEVVYYYGEGCPHCAVVADYISQNKIDEKIKIEKKEVWNSETNATEMKATAKTCNISENDIGVPLMFDKSTSKCYIGDTEVNNFLKTKL